MNRFISASIFSLALVLAGSTGAFADTRSYVWTYEYQTVPKDLAEIEYYVTAQVPDSGHSDNNAWKHWLELEYGLTDHWDVAMYQMWKQTNSSSSPSSQYDGFKIRSRYRFGERGQYFLDPLIYVEYIRDDDFSKPNVGEAKLVLAKTIDNFNFSYNQIVERNLEKPGKTEHAYAAGISYELLPHFKLGIESKGVYDEREHAVGPVLSWANKRFWVSTGAAFGLNDRTNDVEVRAIVGVPF